MSAIGGIAFFGDRPVEPRSTLSILTPALEQWGPDGRQEHVANEVAMVHRPFHTSEQSRKQSQPTREQGGWVLAWDGRLDNARELISALGAAAPPADATHDRLVLAAYRAWGVAGLGRLVGDFALSLFDPQQRCLVLARDAFGARTLFYHRNEGATVGGSIVVWATALEALLEATEPPEVDPEFVADFLSLGSDPAATPYRRHRAVPPGGALVFDQRGGMESIALWAPDLDNELAYADEREYEEEFRRLFYQAVRCRMDVEGTVCSDLSGGLDSSAIVCVGDELVRAGSVSAERLHTLSYVFDEARTSDERKFIEVVEKRIGRRGQYLREEDHRILSDLPMDQSLAYPTVLHLFAARQQHIHRAVTESGARVLLRGTGGDHVLLSETTFPYELADFLVQGRFLKLFGDLRKWTWVKKSSALKLLWGGAVAPLLPRAIQGRFGSYRRVPDWFDTGYAERFRIRERMQGAVPDTSCRLPSTGYHFSILQKIFLPVSWGFYLSSGCLEVSYPFLDRRLVDFTLALPMSQKLRPGQNRSVMRRALADVLPPEIANRRTKQGPDEAILRAFARRRGFLDELFREARVFEQGIVDPQRFRPALQRAQHGMLSDTPVMLRILALELWLRSREAHDAAARARRAKIA